MRPFGTTIAALILTLTFAIVSPPADAQPKREFRAAWVATVVNLDWPVSTNQTSTVQQADLVNLINQIADARCNVVIFQVRAECDAFYASPYEPWSYWMSGTQGSTPIPYFDPLEVAITEAHKRGMELHAWFNPYRAERSAGNYALAPQHVAAQHPEWTFQAGKLRLLDPGKQATREYNLRVFMDVVRRYDIDGVHFDDYFYPYSPDDMTPGKSNDTLDDATFAAEPRGFGNKYDWRRDNINLLFRQLHDSIAAVKPYVKIGVSPFGIWKSGVPTGISGTSAYSSLYCDAMAWLNDQSIDYLTPQLYWRIGGAQDYSKLMPWWSDSVHADGRHLYPGQAPYRIQDGTASAFASASEILNQVRLNRQPGRAEGNVFFRARVGLLDNRNGLLDSLKTDLYKFPALQPVMPWKDVVPPATPAAPQYAPLIAGGPARLQWVQPGTASDGQLPTKYAVYRFTSEPSQPSAIDDPANLLAVTDQLSFAPPVPPNGPTYYYGITALDHNTNESALSPAISVTAPTAPLLASPLDGAGDQPSAVTLSWFADAVTTYYRLQVATDSAFTSLVYDQGGITDTSRSVIVIGAQQRYYWRVNSANGGGTSEFSALWSFVTGFPASPTLVAPPHGLRDVPIPVTFTWNQTATATSYTFQLATNTGFSPSIVDSSGMTDTTITVAGLQTQHVHFWRVRAANAIDVGPWSATNGFYTGVVVGVETASTTPSDYELGQNFPNPFNPATTIRFAVPRSGLTTLRVYDVLGRLIAELVNGETGAGTHTVRFDASSLPSGMYIYVLQSGEFRLARRMVLIR